MKINWKDFIMILEVDFERKAYGMGLNKGMFAQNKHGQYISPVTQKLFEAYKSNQLNAYLVNSLIQDLK